MSLLALEKGPGTWGKGRDGHAGPQPRGDRWCLKPGEQMISLQGEGDCNPESVQVQLELGWRVALHAALRSLFGDRLRVC